MLSGTFLQHYKFVRNCNPPPPKNCFGAARDGGWHAAAKRRTSNTEWLESVQGQGGGNDQGPMSNVGWLRGREFGWWVMITVILGTDTLATSLHFQSGGRAAFFHCPGKRTC